MFIVSSHGTELNVDTTEVTTVTKFFSPGNNFPCLQLIKYTVLLPVTEKLGTPRIFPKFLALIHFALAEPHVNNTMCIPCSIQVYSLLIGHFLP